MAEETGKVRAGGAGAFFGLVVATGIGLAFWIVGTTRLANSPVIFDDSVKLRIVQPNIAQKEKWKPVNRDWIFNRYLSLSDKANAQESSIGAITHLIWPESAVPFLLEESPKELAKIGDLLPENVTLLTGGLRRPDSNVASGSSGKVYNSVLVINDEGKVENRYDKSHLVPFGEYLPLAEILEPLGLRKLVEVPDGFLPGPGPRTVPVPGAPSVSPLICYEAIFPGSVIASGQRPGWMLNVTNDAWFGVSFGPKQHFAQVRMRAVEEGLPLVRAANTGISAIIGPYGRIIKQLPVGVQGVIDGRLPRPVAPTVYSMMRNMFCAILILLGILMSLGLRWRNRHSPN